jgi:hypothetical protein
MFYLPTTFIRTNAFKSGWYTNCYAEVCVTRVVVEVPRSVLNASLRSKTLFMRVLSW